MNVPFIFEHNNNISVQKNFSVINNHKKNYYSIKKIRYLNEWNFEKLFWKKNIEQNIANLAFTQHSHLVKLLLLFSGS